MSQGHQVPVGLSEGGDGPSGPPVAEPTHAERVRTLVSGTNRGFLSTLCQDPAGYPFGSVATYALDERGRPLLFVSTMAEHTRNAKADARASLLAAEDVPEGSDPLAVGRATLIGDLTEVTGDERDPVRDTYLAANPASSYYIDFGDFGFWRLEVQSIRYVGGYGRMSWVDAGAYATSEPDPLVAAAPGIIAHMNADHTDAMIEMARSMVGKPETTGAVMTAVDRYGFDMIVDSSGGKAAVRIGFGAPLANSAEVRPEMVRLVQAVRGK